MKSISPKELPATAGTLPSTGGIESRARFASATTFPRRFPAPRAAIRRFPEPGAAGTAAPFVDIIPTAPRRSFDISAPEPLVSTRCPGDCHRPGPLSKTSSILAARFAAAAFCVLLALLLGWTPGAHATVSNNVPLDHWSYDALDKLAGFGLIHSDLKGLRPYTRIETARLVHEALTTREERKDLKLPPLIEHFLERFQKEFAEELAVYGRGKATSTGPVVFKPVEEIQAQYVFMDGKPRDYVNFSQGVGQYPGASGSGIIANEGTPLLPNNQGVAYGRGSNLSLRFSSSVKLWDTFSAYVEPILIVRENDTAGRDLAVLSAGQALGRLGARDQVNVDLLTGYGKLSNWNVELEFGRDSLWLGQGSRGTLLLTNNATPLDLVKLSNPTPTLLPWIFSYLGPIKYMAFASRLEDDRDFPHPYLVGGRVVLKPHPLFEIGGTGTIVFGGDGSRSLGIPGETSQENGLGAIDARLRLPFLKNAEIYAEYGGEDILTDSPYWYEPFMNDIAWLVGIYFPDVLGDGKTDFRFEYANNAFDQGPGHGGVWYGHGQYTSGYTYDQMILGHRMGPDAQDFYTRITHYLRTDLMFGLDYEHIDRGLTVGRNEERSNGVGTDVTFDFRDNWRVILRYGYESISNFNLTAGDDRDNHLLMTTVKYAF